MTVTHPQPISQLRSLSNVCKYKSHSHTWLEIMWFEGTFLSFFFFFAHPKYSDVLARGLQNLSNHNVGKKKKRCLQRLKWKASVRTVCPTPQCQNDRGRSDGIRPRVRPDVILTWSDSRCLLGVFFAVEIKTKHRRCNNEQWKHNYFQGTAWVCNCWH